MCPSGREPTTQTGKNAVFRVHADGEVHATKGTVGILQVKNNSVEVSDATASGNKIILTTNNINSVSQVLGSSEVPSSQTTESIAVITSQTKPFASDSRNSSQFKCGAEVQMSAQVKGTIRGGGSVKIEIINRTADTTDTIFRQSSAYDDTGSIQINKNIRYRFTTPAYYYIKGNSGSILSRRTRKRGIRSCRGYYFFFRDRCPQEPDRSQRS